jgi:hypothetical protein
LTIDNDLELLAGTNVLLVHQPNGFIPSELFNHWCANVLFPSIREKRECLSCNGLAVVILDGCTCQTTDYFLDQCTFEGVSLLFLPAHSSDQLQPLDLGIFCLQKSEAARIRPGGNLNPQSIQVLKA